MSFNRLSFLLRHPLRFLWLVFALSGCAPQHDETLRVANQVWPGYETFYLARSLGYYDHQPIRMVEMTSASSVLSALRNGTVDAAGVTLDEALTLIQDGVDLRVVLVIDISEGADAIVARPEIPDLKALRGKRVGLDNVGIGALMLDSALEAGGLSVKDINLVPLRLDDQVAAYRDRKVDALVTFAPARTHLIARGAHVLFDSRSTPDRILDVLVVRGEKIATHKNAIQALLKGYFRAMDALAKNPGDAAVRMAPRMSLAPEDMPRQYEGLRLLSVAENQTFLAGNAPRLNALASNLNDLMLRRQLLQHPANVAAISDPSFLPVMGR